MVNGPKQCWNMNDSTFIKFSEKSERNWVKKGLLLLKNNKILLNVFFLLLFWISDQSLNILKKNMTLIAYGITEITDSERRR